jgi:hypothetical protein
LVSVVCLAGASVLCAGEGEAPGKMLAIELRDLSRLLVSNPTPAQQAEVAQKLRQFRERLLEFTRANAGAALEERYWARTFEGVYATSAQYEWTAYPEAEMGVREAWQILRGARPETPGLAYDVAVRLPIWHAQAWAMRNPVECGALLAEAEKNYLPHATTAGRQDWSFHAPNMQRNILAADANLPPEQKAALRAQAEATLQTQINDESLPLDIRNSHLCRWAIQLYSRGEADRAGRILDGWGQKHGDAIVFPEFYYARFFAALRGAGGWGMATQMVNRATQLVSEGKARKDDPFYDLMMKGYYSNIAQPDYELKRRAQTNQTANTRSKGGTE